MSRSSRRPTVVLPQPDSPTSPSVSPRRIVKLTPSTAWTLRDRPLEDAALDREVLHEVADLDERLRRPDGRADRRRRAAPSPRSFAPHRRLVRLRAERIVMVRVVRVAEDAGRVGLHGRPGSQPVIARGAGREHLLGGHVGPRHPARRSRDRPSGRRRDRASSGPRGRRRAGGVPGGRRSAITLSSATRAAQRGAKRQPFGRSIRFGTLPGMTLSSSRTSPTSGIDSIRPACTDGSARRKSVITSACSTISPAYITATRSHISATTPRSWVIRMIAVPVCSRRCRIRSRIWAWIVTSSAVVGSSAISSSGSHARAIAIITRWAMPPDISCGKDLSPALGVRDADHLRAARGRARGPGRCFIPRWSSRTSAIWRPTSWTGFSDDCRLLEDHADPVAPELAHRRRA